MLEITRDNHFQFGYDGHAFKPRKSSKQLFWTNYGKCGREVLDWRSECIIAAREIRKRTDKEIWVCLSGGADSQIVAESFRFVKIPFRAAVLRFNNDYNLHDIAMAVTYCERNSIPYQFFDLNINEFFSRGKALKIARHTHTTTPHFLPVMDMVSKIATRGGYPIVGGGQCYLERGKNKWFLVERERCTAMHRFFATDKIEGVGAFFQWSPEQMFSYLIDPTVKSLTKNWYNENITSSVMLRSRIHEQYFELERRPKYTGFEKLAPLEKKNRVKLLASFPASEQKCFIPYNELVAHLRPLKLRGRKQADSLESELLNL